MPRITKRRQKELVQLVAALTGNQRAWFNRQYRRGIEHLTLEQLDEAIAECNAMLARNLSDMLQPKKEHPRRGILRNMRVMPRKP